MAARINVYKKRAQLRHFSHIWLNEDLVKSRRELDYQARRLYKDHKLAKQWTYMGEVFVKKFTNDAPTRIDNILELLTAAGLPTNKCTVPFLKAD